MEMNSTVQGRTRIMGARLGLALALGLVLINLLLLNMITGRHHARYDWTSSRIFSLSPMSRNVLAGLTRPVKIILFMAPPVERGQRSLYPETLELLKRFAGASSLVSLQRVDPDASPTRTKRLSEAYQISADDLRRGVVVFHSGARSKYVPSSALMVFVPSTGAMAFRGEATLLEALVAVISRKSTTVCFSTGHGEAPIESYDKEGYSTIADQIRRESFKVTTVGREGLSDGAGACEVLIIGGACRAFAPVELDGVDRFLRRNGRLMVLMGPVMDRGRGRFLKIGIEALLRSWGVGVMENIVVDQLAVPGEPPLLTWATTTGYSSHPIARAMAGKLTVWPLTREVRPLSTDRAGLHAVPLVMTSPQGWAETDLRSFQDGYPLQLDPVTDTPGPVSVGLAVQWRETRLIVMGTERGLLNVRQARSIKSDYNCDLLLSSLNWLIGETSRMGIRPKSVEHVRLALDQHALGRIFLVTVVALPMCSLFAGVFFWWRRRR